MAVDDHDTGVAADVAERLVVWARDDVAAVAAHEAELGVSGKRFVPGVGVAGAGGGVYGIWVGEVLGRGYGGGVGAGQWRSLWGLRWR